MSKFSPGHPADQPSIIKAKVAHGWAACIYELLACGNWILGSNVNPCKQAVIATMATKG